VLPCTFADHVAAEQELLSSPRFEELTAYWRDFCAGAPPSLDLPTDRPRPPVQRYAGAATTFRLPDTLISRLHDTARLIHVTPFAFLVSAFEVLLHRYSGQADFLLGCAASTKDRRMADAVGFFVNPVLLRPRLGPETTFHALAAATGAQLRQAMAHRHYPFALLPAALGRPPDPSRPPLFQVLVTAYMAAPGDTLVAELFQGQSRGDFRYAGLNLAAIDMPPQQTGQFDLTLELQMSKNSITGMIKYATDLFDHSTIENLTHHYRTLLESACAEPETPAGHLSMMDEREREQLRYAAAPAATLDW
jgi:non-ribosomal peptide synthetase component F